MDTFEIVLKDGTMLIAEGEINMMMIVFSHPRDIQTLRRIVAEDGNGLNDDEVFE